MPLIIMIIAPGFVGSASLDLAVQNARLMLPYLAFAGPVTVLMGAAERAGALCTHRVLAAAVQHRADCGHRGAAAVARRTRRFAAWMLAATVGIAGLLQLLMLLSQRSARSRDAAARELRHGDARLLRQGHPRHDRKLRPATADGRRRDHRLRVALRGVVALFRQPPDRAAARHCRRRHGHGAGAGADARGAAAATATRVAHAESRALELATGLALPATLGLIVLAEPIVRLLFEHGAFGADDSAATAHALMWLALGLPAHVLIKALSPAFFARSDTMTPLLATAKGLRGRGRARCPARPFLRRERDRRQHRRRRLEQRALAAPERHQRIRLLGRCGRPQPAAADRARRGSPWAACSG